MHNVVFTQAVHSMELDLRPSLNKNNCGKTGKRWQAFGAQLLVMNQAAEVQPRAFGWDASSYVYRLPL